MIIHNYQKVKQITDFDFIHYGYGTFTTISKDTTEELLLLHYNRLLTTSKFLHIELTLSGANFSKLIKTELDKLEADKALKFINTPSGWFLTKRTFKKKSRVNLGIATYRHDQHNPYIYHKTGNYLANIHELKQAQANNYHDMIICNQNDIICETTIANIFWIKDNKLYTPDISCGLLNGTIRQLICNNFIVDFVKDGKVSDLLSADMVFLTNALNKLMIVENYGQALEGTLFNEIKKILGR